MCCANHEEPAVMLLFDENLATRLIAEFADLYQDCIPVGDRGLASGSDGAIWQHVPRPLARHAARSRPTAAEPSDHSLAASINSERNQTCAGSLVARRCHAIDTGTERSSASGMISIAAMAAICRAVRRGTVATKSDKASTAGSAR